MTYNTMRHQAYYRGAQRSYDWSCYGRRAVTSMPAVVQYVSSSRPAYRRPSRSIDVCVGDFEARFTADVVLRGFWREYQGRVDFVPNASELGRRTLRAFRLLGVRVRSVGLVPEDFVGIDEEVA